MSTTTPAAPVALRITPESLRAVIAAVPEVGEMHINEVLGGFIVLNVPRFNKDGSLSKRPPVPFKLFSPDSFTMNFAFTDKQQKRQFVPVRLV